MLIAIPSESPGGLDAAVSAHFGHCHAFTVVQVDDGQIGDVALLPNQDHEQGGCMAPVMHLHQNKVEALVADGKARVFGPAQTCSGGGGHDHGHGGGCQH